MDPRRILILTSDAGFGHRSAATAIDVALAELYGTSCERKIVNPIDDDATPKLIQQLEDGYDDSVTKIPELYRFSYHALDTPLLSEMVRSVAARLFHEVMYKLIQEFQPDVVVSTYPFYAQSVAGAIQDLEIDCPLAVIITDLTDVPALWYSPAATMHFVPTPAIRKQAYDNNIPATRVRVTGLPVNPEIVRETRSVAELRDDLGWEQDVPTCLVVAGPRTQNMAEISQALRQIPELQVCMVCGGDQELFETLKQQQWHGLFHLYGWVEQMHGLMKASDLIVSKAGGLIVSESLACGLPMIISEALPGQEDGNLQYVLEHGAGIWATQPHEIRDTALLWLQHGQAKLKELRANAKSIGKPHAAYDIARGVWGLSERGLSDL